MDYTQGIFWVLVAIAIILGLMLISAWATTAAVSSSINNVKNSVTGGVKNLTDKYGPRVNTLVDNVQKEIAKVNPTVSNFTAGLRTHVMDFLAANPGL